MGAPNLLLAPGAISLRYTPAWKLWLILSLELGLRLRACCIQDNQVCNHLYVKNKLSTRKIEQDYGVIKLKRL